MRLVDRWFYRSTDRLRGPHAELWYAMTDEQRREVRRRYRRRMLRSVAFWLWVIWAFTFWMAIGAAVLTRADWGPAVEQWMPQWTVLVFLSALSCFVWVVPYLFWLRRFGIRTEWCAMSACGIPICGRCGYDLHGIDGEECPECGAERLRPVEDAAAAR